MGNYETLSTSHKPVFFLLQVKSPMIAGDIGAPYGSIVIKHAAAEKTGCPQRINIRYNYQGVKITKQENP
jgi:hypothetical protein